MASETEIAVHEQEVRKYLAAVSPEKLRAAREAAVKINHTSPATKAQWAAGAVRIGKVIAHHLFLGLERIFRRRKATSSMVQKSDDATWTCSAKFTANGYDFLKFLQAGGTVRQPLPGQKCTFYMRYEVKKAEVGGRGEGGA